jgi:ferulate-5-hydroxylase
MAVLAKIAMECVHDPLLWLFVASLVFVILQTRRLGRAPFPPGPKPLPIIGNMALVDQLTHRGLGALAKQYGGLLHLRFGWLHVFAVSTPEYAREVLHAQDGAFSNRPATMAVHYLTYGRSDMAFAHNGAYWRQMRKLCVTKVFSRRRLALPTPLPQNPRVANLPPKICQHRCPILRINLGNRQNPRLVA